MLAHLVAVDNNSHNAEVNINTCYYRPHINAHINSLGCCFIMRVALISNTKFINFMVYFSVRKTADSNTF